MKALNISSRRFLWVACLLLLAALVACGSAPAEAQAQSSTKNPQNQLGPASDQHAADEKAQPPEPQKETRISPREAEELFRSVDEIISFSSHDTGLPVFHPVKRQLIGRDELTAYLEKHMEEDKDSQRLKRSELVLKKFGLLPRSFDLHRFLLALLREQVAGYYDVETQTVNLLDWVDAEQQKPVLAHELTHALQDQSFHLENWMKVGQTDLGLSERNPTPEDIERDEAQSVRQAVVEGQAMAVLVDYTLAPTGQSLTTSPEIVEALKAGMMVGTGDSVEFQNAPIFLKEVLTFPYRYGLDFVTEVLSRRGKQKAFAGILANPPHTTREIMEPNSYLAGERIQPLPVPDFAQLMKNYQKFDVGSMGEFDVALLLDEYTGPDTSKALYPNWRGGYYYAAKPKGDPTSPLAIVYVSQWASAESAQKFAGIYAGSLKKRYRSVQAVARNSDRDPPAGLTQAVDNDGEWLTEEGEVVIDAEGGTVFITESVDEVTSRKLRNAVLNRSQTSPSMGLENFQVAPLCSSVLSAVNAFSFLSPPSPMARNDRPSPLR